MAVKAVSRKTEKAKTKKKVSKATPVEDALEVYRKITKARYDIAKSTYENQDALTKQVIDRIRDRLVIASTGVVNINGRPYKLEQKYIDFNIWFLATEIMADLAINGIRVANFKLDPMHCAECKKRITHVKEPKRSRRG